MIALCLKHHAMADRGVFSKARLKAFKSSSHSVEEVRAKFEWTRPKQLIRLGGFYMGGKNVVMKPEVGVFMEKNFVGLRENSVGLLELSFFLRDRWMNRVAVMENNMFIANPDRLFDLRVNAGATTIRIWEKQRTVLLDLGSSRKTPEELLRMLETDWESAQKAIQKKAATNQWPSVPTSLRTLRIRERGPTTLGHENHCTSHCPNPSSRRERLSSPSTPLRLRAPTMECKPRDP